MSDVELDLTIVTMVLEAASEAMDELMSILAKYVVLSRQHEGCRNIDLCHSQTHLGRFLIVEKWDSPESQRTHFDSADMVQMAQSCHGLLAHPPRIDLFEGLSAHDLH